jgi:hypothetical protein
MLRRGASGVQRGANRTLTSVKGPEASIRACLDDFSLLPKADIRLRRTNRRNGPFGDVLYPSARTQRADPKFSGYAENVCYPTFRHGLFGALDAVPPVDLGSVER